MALATADVLHGYVHCVAGSSIRPWVLTIGRLRVRPHRLVPRYLRGLRLLDLVLAV